MRISVSDAEDQLDDLIDLAHAGEVIILTIDGKDVARLEPATEPAEVESS